MYRPDYHAELWRMAVAADGEGPIAAITLGAEVVRAVCEDLRSLENELTFRMRKLAPSHSQTEQCIQLI